MGVGGFRRKETLLLNIVGRSCDVHLENNHAISIPACFIPKQ